MQAESRNGPSGSPSDDLFSETPPPDPGRRMARATLACASLGAEQRFAPLVFPKIEGEPEPVKAIRRIHSRIQKACKHYCLYPRLTWILWQRDWTLGFYTEAQSDENPVVYSGFDDYGRRVFEGDAAIVVIGIAQRGEISRLRACEQCGSWFFASANTSHNARKFCQDACRLKHFHHRRYKDAQRR